MLATVVAPPGAHIRGASTLASATPSCVVVTAFGAGHYFIHACAVHLHHTPPWPGLRRGRPPPPPLPPQAFVCMAWLPGQFCSMCNRARLDPRRQLLVGLLRRHALPPEETRGKLPDMQMPGKVGRLGLLSRGRPGGGKRAQRLAVCRMRGEEGAAQACSVAQGGSAGGEEPGAFVCEA